MHRKPVAMKALLMPRLAEIENHATILNKKKKINKQKPQAAKKQ